MLDPQIKEGKSQELEKNLKDRGGDWIPPGEEVSR